MLPRETFLPRLVSSEMPLLGLATSPFEMVELVRFGLTLDRLSTYFLCQLEYRSSEIVNGVSTVIRTRVSRLRVLGSVQLNYGDIAALSGNAPESVP